MGDIERIKGLVDTRLLADVIEVEDTAEASIVFRNDAVALFYATNCYITDSPVEIELFCENALITIKDGLTIEYKNGESEFVDNKFKPSGEKDYWGGGHQMLIDDYYTKLNNGESFQLDGTQGIKAIQIINAIYNSNREKTYKKFGME